MAFLRCLRNTKGRELPTNSEMGISVAPDRQQLPHRPQARDSSVLRSESEETGSHLYVHLAAIDAFQICQSLVCAIHRLLLKTKLN